MAAALGVMAAASCSDYDDYNKVPAAEDPVADKTLWENISGNPELSDFADVLVRMGYDKILDASRTYTVWAPVNGSFSVDSLAQVSDEKVEKEFLKNLIADYAHRETDINDTVVYMLNEKLLTFTGKNSTWLAFDAQRVLPNAANPSVFNYPCSNGLLYTVSAPAVFRYNGYEYLFEMGGVADKLMAYAKKYETVTLDESASVKGEIRDGVQHYDDSVIVVSNSLIRGRLDAQLENEDSLYTVLIPTDEAWEKAYEKIAAYYNYIPSISYQDLSHADVNVNKGGDKSSIMKATVGAVTVALDAAPADAEIGETAPYWTDSITKNYLTYELIYSENNKRYNGKLSTGAAFTDKDTLRSTTRGMLTNLPALDAATQQIVRLSNGHARIINEYPFLPEETYAPEIATVEVARIVTASGSDYSYERISRNMLDPTLCVLDKETETSLTYVKAAVPASSGFAPELDFYLPGVRSTTYDVYVVMVPACIEGELSEEERKPYSLYVDINYTDASNTQIAGRFNGEEVVTGTANIKKVEPFEVGRDKVDTLKVGRLAFPVCYVGTGAQPNIKVMHSFKTFLSSQKKKYEQTLRIAKIMLKPVNEEDEQIAEN